MSPPPAVNGFWIRPLLLLTYIISFKLLSQYQGGAQKLEVLPGIEVETKLFGKKSTPVITAGSESAWLQEKYANQHSCD